MYSNTHCLRLSMPGNCQPGIDQSRTIVELLFFQKHFYHDRKNVNGVSVVIMR
ncbi:capsid assembly protein [Salmonella phage 19]|nr:capsid assembly protein [Salmonella phage 19]